MAERTSKHIKSVNLALQGGGAHGAFTWGVLDKIFEDGRIWIDAISGTSAGAMNAAVAAMGMYDGGGDGARVELERFWRSVSNAGMLSPFQVTPLDRATNNFSLDSSPGYVIMDLINRLASPYDLNPTRMNPLRDLVNDFVDFERVRAAQDMEVYISATNVETGRVRIFSRDEIDLDVIMASACLPFMFHAVEIDGEYFWDGGYMGNPVLLPFMETSASDDIVIVQINPVHRAGEPRTARDILNRVNEITFNASLLKELRMIKLIDELVDTGHGDTVRSRRMNIHMIESRKAMRQFSASSKLNTDWTFLTHLRDIGRNAADRWINDNFEQIGVGSTLDLDGLFSGLAPAKKHVPRDS
ncbi:MAG: patatin-like phospholipase family protein [Pseudomonadota bacterium]